MADPAAVEELVRCRRAALSASVPQAFSFYAAAGRLLFLGAGSEPAAEKPLTSLYSVALPPRAGEIHGSDDPPALPWEMVVSAARGGVQRAAPDPPANGTAAQPPDAAEADRLSKEEELLRERLRMHSVGISFYFLHEKTGTVLVPLAGELLLADLRPRDPPALAPETHLTPVGHRWRAALRQHGLGDSLIQATPVSDPKWSPDGTLISYIRNDDIYVADVRTGIERRLTFATQRRKHTTAGVAEYVMQEEFDRYTGYWWAPARDPVTGEWLIMYLEVYDGDVPTRGLPRLSFAGEIDEYPYPRVGDENAVSDARLVRVPLPPEVEDCDPATAQALRQWAASEEEEETPWSDSRPLLQEYSWAEYVVDAGHIPRPADMPNEEQFFWFMLLDREQRRRALVVRKAAVQSPYITVHEEANEKYWINVGDSILWIANECNSTKFAFIFMSELSGFAHLYKKVFDMETGLGSVQTLTSGDWIVDTLVGHDLERSLLYFSGSMDTPLERHLYCVSYGSSQGGPTRLTDLGCNYSSFCIDTDTTWCACNFSSLNEPPASQLFEITHPTPETAALRPCAKIDNPPLGQHAKPSWELRAPELFHFELNDGTTLHGCVYKPAGGTGPFPTVLNTYGGPRVQLVMNDFRLTQHYKHQLLAHLGYAVVVVDGRGSYKRGLAFEGAIYKHLGKIELEDQVAGVEYMIRQGVVDGSRVAMSGWSYGGYMALMAMAKRPDFFKLSIAGAPVVRWEAYDTGYTERYLGLLETNQDGYDASSVLTYADNFPAEEDRLLVVHSFMDENVHFCHTTMLIEALVLRNKPHKLVLFPKERHGLRDSAAQLHFETVFFNFVVRHL
mmetsp:Transcript_31369/g.76851  ORF Transcript_31369/g.76851 Transcript_31369/m.76851 type:complete len:844 (+) Transcript_31369:157-2688(+)